MHCSLPTMEPTTTSKCITDAAFLHLQEIGRIDRELTVDIPDNLVYPVIKWPQVLFRISETYDIHLSESSTFDQLAEILPERVQAASVTISKATSLSTLFASSAEQLVHRSEFQSEYHGGDTVPSELFNHIMVCWHKYTQNRKVYKYPYTAILQSSGFGKSRLLRELADLTITDPEAQCARVLYVCAEQDTVEGYPRPTTLLWDWLFPRYSAVCKLMDGLVERLFQVFCYAFEHRMTVAAEWLGLFVADDGGESVRAKLASYTPSDLSESCQVEDDEEFVVVLALDEARELFAHRLSEVDVGWFKRLRNALAKVNGNIQAVFGGNAGIFGIFVDTNSKITNFVPPSRSDKSLSDANGAQIIKLLRPFVLTQTMDAAFDAFIVKELKKGATPLDVFKHCVCSTPEESWRHLVSMGRPLWQIRSKHITKGSLIELAASMLLAGKKVELASLNDESMFGVASILCRLGLRPHSWSPFSTKIVSDFMAVLSYVCISREQFISTYSTEPLLTFGAALLWYKFGGAFDSHILPQFCKLMRQDVMDTGGIGETVAAMILLLAIDATGVSCIRTSTVFAGKFQNVWLLLKLFQGPGLDLDDASKADPRCKELSTLLTIEKQQWKGWKVGFSHFVQLIEEPDTEMLWSLLTRRAAAIMPRNFKGVDLLIPIFKPPTDTAAAQVSMILVQVKNRAGGDSAFPDSATVLMRPSMVFSAKNILSRVQPGQMIRLYMSLRSEDPSRSFYVFDRPKRKSSRKKSSATATVAIPDEGSYALCVEGLKQLRSIPSMTAGVITMFESLLRPWFRVAELVKADTEAATDINQADAIGNAVIPLAENLLTKRDLVTNALLSATLNARDESDTSDDEMRTTIDTKRSRKGSRT